MPWFLFWQIVMLIVLVSIAVALTVASYFDDKGKYEYRKMSYTKATREDVR